MKKVLGILIVVLGVGALILFFHSKTTPLASSGAVAYAPPAAANPTVASPAPSPIAASSASAITAVPSPPATVPVPENLAAQAGQMIQDTNTGADLSPEDVLHNVRRAVRLYGEMFNGNPVGVNSEITAALAGQNPKHINFIDASGGMRVNANGELIDAWGTPYFFHQISGTDMEIHSAGPDRVMWTSDDIVVR